jgi:tripartite-type tricarboxylate transporter receptor subunit TctC
MDRAEIYLKKILRRDTMKKRLMIALSVMVVFVLVAGTAGAAPAGEFPQKNIKIIVPFDPGGAVDVTCRFLAELAPQYFNGKKIIIENMAGGGGVVGQNAGAKAPADGYAVLAFTSSVVTNPMTKKTDYTHESFTPVIMYCYDPEVLVVSSESNFKSLDDVIAAAKQGSISLCTPGKSTSHHIAGMILEDKTGAKFDYIHNNGAAMQVAQLLGGHVQMGLMAYGEAKSQIVDGKLRVLGIMSDSRDANLKDVPTFKEKGIDILYGAWRGLAVPAKTPKEAVAVLEKGFESIVKNPQYIEKMAKAGYPIVYKNSASFTEHVAQDAENLKKVLPLLNK